MATRKAARLRGRLRKAVLQVYGGWQGAAMRVRLPIGCLGIFVARFPEFANDLRQRKLRLPRPSLRFRLMIARSRGAWGDATRDYEERKAFKARWEPTLWPRRALDLPLAPRLGANGLSMDYQPAWPGCFFVATLCRRRRWRFRPQETR